MRELIERLEKATGPDRELDYEIGLATKDIPLHWRFSEGNILSSFDLVRNSECNYTASLDAAVALAERVHHAHGRKLICFFCAGGQLTPENADAESADYHPLAKIDNSVTVGWMSHVAFMKNGSGESFGPDRYSHGKTAPIAVCLALLRALTALEKEEGNGP